MTFHKTRSLVIALALMLLCGIGTAQEPVPIKFSEMYGARTVRGLEFSDLLLEADGERVEMLGYMAPPLKAELDFFVLTRFPLAVCPFCDDAANWPPDIVLVKLPRGEYARSTVSPLRITGRLELGAAVDEETGFVSLVRIFAERVERVQ